MLDVIKDLLLVATALGLAVHLLHHMTSDD